MCTYRLNPEIEGSTVYINQRTLSCGVPNTAKTWRYWLQKNCLKYLLLLLLAAMTVKKWSTPVTKLGWICLLSHCSCYDSSLQCELVIAVTTLTHKLQAINQRCISDPLTNQVTPHKSHSSKLGQRLIGYKKEPPIDLSNCSTWIQCCKRLIMTQ